MTASIDNAAVIARTIESKSEPRAAQPQSRRGPLPMTANKHPSEWTEDD
jgi:hypothetical protein